MGRNNRCKDEKKANSLFKPRSFSTSFPGSLSYPSKDPGWVWSGASQNLGVANKRFGGGADKCEICLCNSVPDLVLKVMTSQDKTSNAENNAQNPLTAKA